MLFCFSLITCGCANRSPCVKRLNCPSVGLLPVTGGGAVGISGWYVLRKFCNNWRNSNSSNILPTASKSGSDIAKSSSSNVTGTSSIMVANCLERIPFSLLLSMFSRSLPFSWSVWARRFSIEPKSASSFLAVFSPTPGSPGILSTASPIIPRKSITCKGFCTSNFSCTSFTPQISTSLPPREGRYIKILSLTSCA